MGKLYQFPEHKRYNSYKAPTYSEDQQLLQGMMHALIATYQEKIAQLESYKEEIRALNETKCDTAKEMLQLVKKMQKLFFKYGVYCNFYRFYTLNHLYILYFNDTNLIYTFEDNHRMDVNPYTPSQFEEQFSNYPFTLNLEDEVFEAFDKQIQDLRITIITLTNTQI